MALVAADLDPVGFGLAIAVPAGHEARLGTELQRLAGGALPDRQELAALVRNKSVERFDMFLADDLLDIACARDRLDVSGIQTLAAGLLRSLLGETHQA